MSYLTDGQIIHRLIAWIAILIVAMVLSTFVPWEAKSAELFDDLDRLNERIDRTVIEFESRDGLCAGSVVDRDRGLILVANHCLGKKPKDGEKYFVKAYDRWTTQAVAVATDRTWDLAVVQTVKPLPRERFDNIQIEPEPVRRGQPVWAVGHPLSVEGVLSSGLVGQVTDKLHDGTTLGGTPVDGMIVYTGLALPGNSGGPLLDKWGRLVGVASYGRLMELFDGQGEQIDKPPLTYSTMTFYIPVPPVVKIIEKATRAAAEKHIIQLYEETATVIYKD